jgi:type 1 glutamine amidotransferase
VWIRAAILALAVAAGGCGGDEPEAEVLVFSRTTSYRHADAIEAGREALADRFGAELTEDPARFSDDGLRDVDVVVLLQTNGPGVLRGDQRAAFERWVRAGGGVVAIHAAANADRDWEFYGELLGGARFESHRQGPLQRETVLVEPHPATAGLPRRWVRSDEWYRFAPEPGPDAHVLATVDGDPMAWTTELDRGRAFYTALGHAGEAWSEPRYRQHIIAAVEWAQATSDATASSSITSGAARFLASSARTWAAMASRK